LNIFSKLYPAGRAGARRYNEIARPSNYFIIYVTFNLGAQPEMPTQPPIDSKTLCRSRRDSSVERAVTQWLRTTDQLDRFRYCWQVLDGNVAVGLSLVKRAQLDPFLLEVILERGLVYSDISSVQVWMEAVIHGVGPRKLICVIQRHLEKAPLCVYKTLYSLPLVINSIAPELCDEVQALAKGFSARYPSFTTKRTYGTHA
jgi:hypothetical protein